MSKIICLMGKSSTGKDTIYNRLLEDESLGLTRLVPYTTRPIRIKEVDGVDYHFVDENRYEELKQNGDILEERAYNTVHGVWRYFTVKDSDVIESDKHLLYIGTLEAYVNLCKSLGKEYLLPIYIETDDGERLSRALRRELKQSEPKYAELCRRFLADTEDFCDEKLAEAGVNIRFINDDLEVCIEQIRDYIVETL